MRDITIEGVPAAPAESFDPSPEGQSTLKAMADIDQRYSVECEYLVGWQGPSPERARLMREIQARYQKNKEALARRIVHFPGRS